MVKQNRYSLRAQGLFWTLLGTTVLLMADNRHFSSLECPGIRVSLFQIFVTMPFNEETTVKMFSVTIEIAFTTSSGQEN